jgi:2-dehydropantoate 2-reductase|tara:strand:+ start:3669 stop:4577 length:909 start_codon:yes stop_codon:yes gene_type:complete
MKILMIGVGGIGGYLGSFLSESHFDVTFIARKERFLFLKSKGLILESQNKKKKQKIKVLEEIPDQETFDLIINTVKLYDFDKVIHEIRRKIVGKFILLPFQNGIYAEEKIKEVWNINNTTGAVAQISAFVDKNQHIKHVGKLATFLVGGYDSKTNGNLDKFCSECQKIGLDMRFKTNIKEKIWDKFIFLSAYSGLTTLTQKTIGEIFDDKTLRSKFILAMKETFNLSKKFGVKFNNDPIELWLEKISKMPYEMTSSMYIDFTKNKKLELNWLSGSIVDLCKKNDIECKVHDEIFGGINQEIR